MPFELSPALLAKIGFLWRSLPVLLDGFAMTLAIAASSMLAACLWGLVLLGFGMSRSRVLRGGTVGYIELVRNTPLLVQIYLLYFGLPLIGLPLSAFVTGLVGIAGQHGAFLAEIYRGGLQSVSTRQWEAGRAVGMVRLQVLRHVVIPQALAAVMPQISNQLLILVKDSAAVAGIGLIELTLAGKIIIERSAASYEVFLAVALFFLALNLAFGLVLRAIETRLRRV